MQAPRRRFAGESQIGVPVADSGRGLALEPARDMRNPLEVDSRGFRLRSVVHGDEGGFARRFSPASGVLSSRAGYDLGKRVQRKGEVQAVLTEGSD